MDDPPESAPSGRAQPPGWGQTRTVETLRLPGLQSFYARLPPHSETTTTGPHQIGIAFTAHPGLVLQTNGISRQRDAPAGAVYVTGDESVHWSQVSGPTEALEMYPDDQLLETVGVSRGQIRESLGSRDGVVFATACILRRAHLGAGLVDIAASTVAHRIGWHLASTYAGGRRPVERPGTLGRRTLQLVIDHVHDHAAGPITLDSLAAVAYLSPFHFARAFKHTTGMTPHAYVTARRMEEAKGRLLCRAGSVSDVALAVGYSNQRHFRRVFQRVVGVLPGEMSR